MTGKTPKRHAAAAPWPMTVANGDAASGTAAATGIPGLRKSSMDANVNLYSP